MRGRFVFYILVVAIASTSTAVASALKRHFCGGCKQAIYMYVYTPRSPSKCLAEFFYMWDATESIW